MVYDCPDGQLFAIVSQLLPAGIEHAYKTTAIAMPTTKEMPLRVPNCLYMFCVYLLGFLGLVRNPEWTLPSKRSSIVYAPTVTPSMPASTRE